MELKIPQSLKLEHEALHELLREAMCEPGELGKVAKSLGKLMHLHFVKEQKYALPPLGLLAALTQGDISGDMSHVLAMTERLRIELPGMLNEHKAIIAALAKFTDAATAAGKSRYADFAGRLTLHARIEEEVSYPAALLVGEYLRRVLAAPLTRGGPGDAVEHPAAADYNLSIGHGTW